MQVNSIRVHVHAQLPYGVGNSRLLIGLINGNITLRLLSNARFAREALGPVEGASKPWPLACTLPFACTSGQVTRFTK